MGITEDYDDDEDGGGSDTTDHTGREQYLCDLDGIF